jgi:hypothetical protein
MLYNKVDGNPFKHPFKVCEKSISDQPYNLFLSAYETDGFSARLWSLMLSL